MKVVLKNLLSLILPVTVTILVPMAIGHQLRPSGLLTTLAGLLLILCGLIPLVLTISKLIVQGRGTLAPWSPTRNLVTTGLYHHVRNPMILGVLTILAGESVLFRSLPILWWMILFFLINHTYFLFYEEPSLLRRFGKAYLQYQAEVPRWIPGLGKLRRRSVKGISLDESSSKSVSKVKNQEN
ncbi:MAG: isoprenylcysteine carboxylmethyltransferase family protein [Marinilabiliales bacterium]|nr:isoprenylcysteine carboxylmethyltransferase family protein [Marinilabiliales bacterium]